MNLGEDLKRATFDAGGYFLNLEAGCYIVSDEVFKDTTSHPSISESYKRFKVMEVAGMIKGECPENFFTIFKSVGNNHLEFINGAVLIRNIKGEL